MSLLSDFTGAIVIDPTYQREAWALRRVEELRNPATLAEAVNDCEALARDLLSALTERHDCGSSLDRTVLQHAGAQAVVERYIDQVLAAEDRRDVRRHFNPYPEAA